MKRLAIFFSLFVFVVSAVSVYAGSGAWTGPDGVTLNGLTYNTSQQVGSVTWYYAHANTWRSTPTVRYISAKSTIYNDCGGFHYITEASGANINATSAAVNNVLAGSSQCTGGTISFVQNNGRHHEQLWNYSTLTKTTQEITNVP